MKTRNFADVIRAKLAADPELARAVGLEKEWMDTLTEACAEAKAEEREAIAVLADILDATYTQPERSGMRLDRPFSDRIRARGAKPKEPS